MLCPSLLPCAAVLIAGGLAAQTTWIVDVDGGPGSQFATITEALDAARCGDSILVRPGIYNEGTLTTWPTTDKGLRLVADPGVTITGLPLGRFTVSGLPAGKTFSMRGFDFSPVGIFQATDNDGLVHLEDLGLSTSLTSPATLFIDDCAQITLTDVQAIGYNTVQRSTAASSSPTVDSASSPTRSRPKRWRSPTLRSRSWAGSSAVAPTVRSARRGRGSRCSAASFGSPARPPP